MLLPSSRSLLYMILSVLLFDVAHTDASYAIIVTKTKTIVKTQTSTRYYSTVTKISTCHRTSTVTKPPITKISTRLSTITRLSTVTVNKGTVTRTSSVTRVSTVVAPGSTTTVRKTDTKTIAGSTTTVRDTSTSTITASITSTLTVPASTETTTLTIPPSTTTLVGTETYTLTVLASTATIVSTEISTSTLTLPALTTTIATTEITTITKTAASSCSSTPTPPPDTGICSNQLVNGGFDTGSIGPWNFRSNVEGTTIESVTTSITGLQPNKGSYLAQISFPLGTTRSVIQLSQEFATVASCNRPDDWLFGFTASSIVNNCEALLYYFNSRGGEPQRVFTGTINSANEWQEIRRFSPSMLGPSLYTLVLEMTCTGGGRIFLDSFIVEKP